jgi:hypothetical protein
MGAKRAIYFGPPDRPNRGFFYGPSYESIWTNDFHYKACCDHEKNYFQFDGEGDVVGRPQTLLTRSWRLELEKQAQERHVAARVGTGTGSGSPKQQPPQTLSPPPTAIPILANCSPELCPPHFRPAGAKRFTLSPAKTPLPPKEFARELWNPTHTRIIYMKTAKPSASKPPPAALPPIASPAVSPQKAHQQLKEQQQQQQLKQQQQQQQFLKEQQHFLRQSTVERSGPQTGRGGTGVLLTRDGEVRKDYVSEVKALMESLEQQRLLDLLSKTELEESIAFKRKQKPDRAVAIAEGSWLKHGGASRSAVPESSAKNRSGAEKGA